MTILYYTSHPTTMTLTRLEVLTVGPAKCKKDQNYKQFEFHKLGSQAVSEADTPHRKVRQKLFAIFDQSRFLPPIPCK